MNPDFTNLQIGGVSIAGQPGPAGSYFVIYEFFSRNPGQGEARSALEQLKQTYQTLEVTDIGHKGDNSYKFWKHMLRQQLVSAVHDANGVIHKLAKTM